MRNKITDIIFDEIDKFNKERSKSEKIKKATSTHLTGPKTELDSVELIGLLVSLEEKVNKLFKKKIKIADEKIIEKPENISTIDKLIDLICDKIKKK
tara:strand:- start:239 stop:529 length:291 start_codon:yes stop_codon:yes gene_type:complete